MNNNDAAVELTRKLAAVLQENHAFIAEISDSVNKAIADVLTLI